MQLTLKKAPRKDHLKFPNPDTYSHLTVIRPGKYSLDSTLQRANIKPGINTKGGEIGSWEINIIVWVLKILQSLGP
jgi:hypothetical protein